MNERASQPHRARLNRNISDRAPDGATDRAADRPLDRPSPVDYLEYEALTLEDPEAGSRRRVRTWPALGLAWMGLGIGAASLLAPRQVARLVPRRFAYAAIGAMAALGLVGSYLARDAGQRARCAP